MAGFDESPGCHQKPNKEELTCESQPAKHKTLFMRHHARIKDHTPFFPHHVGIGFNELPSYHQYNVDANTNVKNRTRRCAINLRGFSFAQHPILKFQGQEIHIELVKMKSKASSQTFTCRFCLQCFVPLPSAVFSCVQIPDKPC